METKTFNLLPLSMLARQCCRWLCLFALMLMGGVILPASAQSKDVITFTGGAQDPKDPNIYVIDAGNVAVDEDAWVRHFSITLRRPQGTLATEAATIQLREVTCYMDLSDVRPTVTFAPGETEKTIDVAIPPYPVDYGSGNMPAVFNVFYTEHCEAEYQVLVVKMNTPAMSEMVLTQCTLATPLEVLQNDVTDFAMDRIYHWGEYAIIRLEFTAPVKIEANSHYVLQVRETDHSGLAIDAEDWGLSKTREVELTPLNAGSVCNHALFLYRPAGDEMLNFAHSEGYVWNQMYSNDKEISYHVLEAGPFEVANPMEGGLKYISFSREDLENAKVFYVRTASEALHPQFSDVSINKTSFKSGETMIITAAMDNWQFLKRMRQEDFIKSFGVKFNGNTTIESCRSSFDEATGRVTCCVTAPTVNELTDLQVEFGPIVTTIGLDEWGNEAEIQKVIPGTEGSFSVSVSSEPSPEVPATSIDLASLPADGSAIVVSAPDDWIWRTFPLSISTLPANATDAGEVTYTVENMGNADASIGDNNGKTLYTGSEQGSITVKATLPSGVSTERTYLLWVAPPEGVHHTNTFLAGTTFTKFEFEIKNDVGRVKDDKVTINFTHVNGTTWSETYQFSKLKHRRTDAGTICYTVPFNFTEEHPEPTSDQIDKPVITAQAVMEMAAGNGQSIPVEATATLMAELKKPSFDGYKYVDVYYTDNSPAAFNTTVMYLPRKGFTVGYLLPDINVEKTYSNLSGDPVPDWLTLEEDGDYYYTAHINAQLDLHGEDANSFLYTLAQRSYLPDEAMEHHRTRWCQFHYASAEDNLVFRVNGADASGDLTFDNSAGVATFINKVKNSQDGILWSDHVSWGDYNSADNAYSDFMRVFSAPGGGFYSATLNKVDDIYDEVIDLVNQSKAEFQVGDRVFGGVEVTLKCEGEVIQTIKTDANPNVNSDSYSTGWTAIKSLYFTPPSDGHTYTVEVYYPAYDKRYTATFVSAPFSNIYVLHTKLNYLHPGEAELLFTDGITDRSIQFVSTNKPPYYHHGKIKGFVYAENPHSFYVHDMPENTSYKESKIRLSFDNALMPIGINSSSAEIQYSYSPYGYEHQLYNKFHGNLMRVATILDWNNLNANNTLVTVVNSQGQPITNATINYAFVDKDMALQGDAGSTGYDSNLNAYQVSTDPAQFAQLIEVVAPGYDTQLATMYLWNYNYYSWGNRGKMRRYTVVMQEQEALHSLVLETPKRSGKLVGNEMSAELNTNNLLMTDEGETLNYSQTAEQPTATKHIKDQKFGNEGWSGTKYIHITGMMPYASTPSLTLATANGSIQLQPEMKYITTADFPFSQNYCLFDFDLTDQIEDEAKFTLKNGTQTLATLPTLHNYDLELAAMDEASNVSLAFDTPDLTKVDNDAAANGVNMKDSGKAFDKFNFQLPPVLPFTVDIQRDGDYFIIRACMEKNFLPGGQALEALDQIDNLAYFNDQYQACMDAVNSGKPADDDFFDDIPVFPSAFVGIKGYLTGIGYFDRENKKFQFNFYDGGLVFEASAKASAPVSFGIGSFGMSIDAKMAMTMGLVNTAAEMGDVSFKSTKIDFFFDYQARLKVCAWAYAGIDIWIAKAVAGVRGGACIDMHSRAYVTKGQAGMKTTLQAKMEAFAEARFLFFKAKKTWPIFNVYKEYLVPNNPTNPFHPANPEPLFARRNVTKGYKKLKRKVIADLGTPIISNVNGMARPDYLLGGESLLFNNLKTASNYNDDRLQLYSNGSKNDLVSTGIDAPMYDFAEAHNNNGMELVAFEQVKEEINGSELEAMSENDQTKVISEKSEIHVAMRQNGGSWTTETVGSYWSDGIACVTPAVAVQSDGKAVVIWQQGVAKFNDQGERYIDGSLMLSRYDGSSWGEPIEIKRLNRRSVPADYQVTMKNNEVLVMMTLQQDVNNQMTQASVVYVSIDANDKVREHYTLAEGSKPQMVSVGDANLVGFLKVSDEGRDIELNTVNMKGEPTGKLTGLLGMKKRTVNDFRLIVDDAGTDLSDVALLWTQSDEETTDNGDGTMTVNMKNRLYASKLCSHDKQLYFSTPVEIATMPDDVSLASMDGYLSDRDMKVAYCVTNEEDGGAVLESSILFDNAIDHKISFNAYDVNNDQQVPVTITVVNNGFEPIESIDVTMGSETSTRNVTLMPQESTELEMNYTVDDNFNGTIDYDVTAHFIAGNSNALKIKRKGALSKAPRRAISQTGTQLNVRQVDMALKILSKKTDATGTTTIVAEVNNASLLPLAPDMSVKVGLYSSPVVDENVVSYAETTVSAADLYDASAEQKNKVKIVTLTVPEQEYDQVLYLNTTPMQGSEPVKDVRPSNNVLPVKVAGKSIATSINQLPPADQEQATGQEEPTGGNTLYYDPSGIRKSNQTKGVTIVVKDGKGRKVYQGK